MLGGVIAFSLFFAFNRLHHRVDHWIEHLFFRQWRARESELRLFVKKAGHFIDRTSLMTAFNAALDRFSDGAGNAIYLAGAGGCFERVQSTLSSAWEHLDVDDDLVVSLRTHRHGVLAEGREQAGGALALPVLQGNELTGILLLGAKQDVQGYRPDEHAVLEFVTASIGMELARLQLVQLKRQLQQLQQKEELQCREQRQQQQELDNLKAERATFLLALSKLGT